MLGKGYHLLKGYVTILLLRTFAGLQNVPGVCTRNICPRLVLTRACF